MAENQNNNVEFTSNKDQHLKTFLKGASYEYDRFRWRYWYRLIRSWW